MKKVYISALVVTLLTAFCSCTTTPKDKSEINGVSSNEDSSAKEIIARTIRSQMNSIRKCYELGIIERTLENRITLWFKILPTGKVDAIKATRNEPLDAELEQCLKTLILNTDFSEAAKAKIQTVSYPFFFLKN